MGGTMVGEEQDYNVIRAAMWFDTASPIFLAAPHYYYDPYFGNLPEVQVNYSYYDCPITEKDGSTSRLPDGFLWCGGYINATRFPLPGKNCRYYNQNSMNGGGPNFGTTEQTDAVLQAFVDLPTMQLPVTIDLTGYARCSPAGMALKATLVERGYTVTVNEPIQFKPLADISAVATAGRDDAVDITFGFNWEGESWLYMHAQFSLDGGETWGDDQWPWAYPWNGNPVTLSAVGALQGETQYKLRMCYTTDYTNWSDWCVMPDTVTTNPVMPLAVPELIATLSGRRIVHFAWTEANWNQDQRMFDIQSSPDGVEWTDMASGIWHWYWDTMTYDYSCPAYETLYYFRVRCRTYTKTSDWSPAQMITTGIAPNWQNTLAIPPPAITGLNSYVLADPGLVDAVNGEVSEITDYGKTQSFRRGSSGANPLWDAVKNEVIFNQSAMRFLVDRNVATVDNPTFVMIGRQLANPNIGDCYGPLMGTGSGEPYGSRIIAVGGNNNRFSVSGVQNPDVGVNNCSYNQTAKNLFFGRVNADGSGTAEHCGSIANGTLARSGSGGGYGLYLGAYRRHETYSFAKIVGNFAMTAALYFDHPLTSGEVTTLKAWIATHWPEVVLAA